MNVRFFKNVEDLEQRPSLSSTVLSLISPRPYIKGLDINRYQAGQMEDAKKIKAAGYEFAILEACWGLWEPPSFRTFWPRLLDAGVILLAYGFFRGDQCGNDQADFLLNVTSQMFQAQGFRMPLALDVEPWVNDTSTLVQRVVGFRYWCSAIRETTTPMPYSNQPSWRSQVNNELLPDYCLGWTAHYNPTTYPLLPFSWKQEQTPFHQVGIAIKHSWCPPVPGMASDVDVDRFYGSVEQLLALGNGVFPEPEEPPMPAIDELKEARNLLLEADGEIQGALGKIDNAIAELEGTPPIPPVPTPPPAPSTDTWLMTVKEDPRTKAWCFEVWNENRQELVPKVDGAGKPIIQEYLDKTGKRITFDKGVQVRTYREVTTATGGGLYHRISNRGGDRGQMLFLLKAHMMKPG